jgi:hypothetical protein
MATRTKAAAKTKTPAARRKPAAAAPATAAKTGSPKAATAAKPVKAARTEKAPKKDKADKPRKPKLVRDSFTIPKDEYVVLEALKERAARLGRPTKKSEMLRAGVQALALMPDAAFLARVGAVPAVKTGRPAKT